MNLEEIKEQFENKIDINIKSKRRIYINAASKDTAKELVTYLFNVEGARLSTISGVDNRGFIELLYHMSIDKEGRTVSIRVEVKKPDPTINTVTDVIEGAQWVEREVHEMFGVNFKGHPNLTRLLLPDDWPDNEYPLTKKSFDSENEVIERE